MDNPLGHQKKPTKVAILTSAAFVKDFTPPDYLIEDIVISGYVYALTAKTGDGKTAVGLRLSAHVALGSPLMAAGPAVKKGRVLYFAGENDEDVKMRWIKLADEMKFDIDKIDVDFYPGRLDLEKFSEAIQNYAEETKDGYALIIVDTSQAFFQGQDESSRKEMLDHAMTLRKLTKVKGNPAVIVLCHPIKNWVPGVPLLPSGGGSFLNEIDGNLTLQRLGSSTVVELYWAGKFRGPKFEKPFFELVPGTHDKLKTKKGKPITTVFAKPVPKATAEQKRASSDDAGERLMMAMEDGAERSLPQIAEKCGWFHKSGEPNKQLAKRLLDGLPAGLASQNKASKNWRLTDKGRAEAKRLAERPL